MDVVVCLVIVIVLLWVVCFVEVLTSGSQVLPWVLVLLLAVTVVKAVMVLCVSMCVCGCCLFLGVGLLLCYLF